MWDQCDCPNSSLEEGESAIKEGVSWVWSKKCLRTSKSLLFFSSKQQCLSQYSGLEFDRDTPKIPGVIEVLVLVIWRNFKPPVCLSQAKSAKSAFWPI